MAKMLVNRERIKEDQIRIARSNRRQALNALAEQYTEEY